VSTIFLLLLLQIALPVKTAATAPEVRPDCVRFARMLSDIARGATVSPENMTWAMKIEQAKSCNNQTSWRAVADRRATPQPTQVPSRASSQPYVGAAGPRVPAFLPKTTNCVGAMVDEASTRPCDWLALHYAFSTGRARQKDLKQALYWLQKAADTRHPSAEFLLGEAYETGRLTPVNEVASTRWLIRAAQQGHVEAQASVGQSYYEGYGVPVDKSQAAGWFRRAVAGGDIGAMAMLGLMLEEGDGVPVNGTQAVALYRTAADRGQPAAQHFLGRAYLTGKHISFDVALARSWLTKAAAGGQAGAQRDLAKLDTTQRQIAAERASIIRSAASSNGPSLADQVNETNRRQNRENCAAAAQGRNRVCNPNP